MKMVVSAELELSVLFDLNMDDASSDGTANCGNY